MTPRYYVFVFLVSDAHEYVHWSRAVIWLKGLVEFRAWLDCSVLLGKMLQFKGSQNS